MTSASAFISGCAGKSLNADERRFFSSARPWGLILFARNVESPSQIRDLTADFRACVGRPDAPVLIDQEGGRVQRLSPATGGWRAYPPARRFAELYASDPVAALRATRLIARLMADDLSEAGIDVDCLPVLDVPEEGAHEVIGSRAYGREPGQVALLGLAAAAGFIDGGVLPVMKHIPGHGRARADSHHELPRVSASRLELARDFAPFAAATGLIPMAMSAHVVFSSIDPEAPATLSARVIAEVIRGEIGFDGLLMTDDLSMKALDGSLASRAARARAAGCDMVLHCSGILAEMEEVAAASGPLDGPAATRAARALAARRVAAPFDRHKALELIAGLAPPAA